MDTREYTESFNTARGKHCCNLIRFLLSLQLCKLVSIPQAVSTVATIRVCLKDIKKYQQVSIPQAVSTVATLRNHLYDYLVHRFNTASGKHCCNLKISHVCCASILSFNTASGKHCCNHLMVAKALKRSAISSFNTASGKHCCNLQSVSTLTVRSLS